MKAGFCLPLDQSASGMREWRFRFFIGIDEGGSKSPTSSHGVSVGVSVPAKRKIHLRLHFRKLQ
ncbi:MAG: hypothetical protein ACJAQ4_000151 [Cryomorphaceae bacterium]|jgi:hypothetical protein